MHGQVDPVQRATSPKERELLHFLLERGYPEAYRFIPQIDEVEVVGECSCGCDSFYFLESNSANRLVLTQHWSEGTDGSRLGVTAYAIDERLAGVEFLGFDWKGDIDGETLKSVID